MPQDLVIDAHVHTFKTPEIGQQAMAGNGQSRYSGTIEELVPLMQQAGIARAAMVNMTPVLEMRLAALERQTEGMAAREMAIAERRQLAEMIGRLVRRNEWTCAVAREHPALLAFISVIPEMGSEAMLNEIEDKLAKGAHGLKLHPADCAFYPADPALWPVYRYCEERALPIIAHAGTFHPEVECSQPKFFVPVLKAFPRLKLVLAHLGRPFYEETVALAKAFPNVCFDTSAAISGSQPTHRVPLGDEVRLIRALGVERVLFGSDFPWYDPERDIAFLSALELSDGERRAILGENAARVFDK